MFEMMVPNEWEQCKKVHDVRRKYNLSFDSTDRFWLLFRLEYIFQYYEKRDLL